ncbi:MAG: PAS domain S-box protein [Richelia sp. SM2_1_7]|nr:PAS domain S-box protein [Richelia sp. SM2_1_7]
MHSQLIKFARLLVSLIVIAIFLLTGWLLIRDEKLIFSDSVLMIAYESLVAIGIFAILIWKGTKIIESTCNQRDKAINALKENEAKLRSFLDTNFIGIVEVNADGNIYVANDEFLRITGYSYSCLQMVV